jgi:hypothetical protein
LIHIRANLLYAIRLSLVPRETISLLRNEGAILFHAGRGSCFPVTGRRLQAVSCSSRLPHARLHKKPVPRDPNPARKPRAHQPGERILLGAVPLHHQAGRGLPLRRGAAGSSAAHQEPLAGTCIAADPLSSRFIDLTKSRGVIRKAPVRCSHRNPWLPDLSPAAGRYIAVGRPISPRTLFFGPHCETMNLPDYCASSQVGHVQSNYDRPLRRSP